MLLHVAVAGSSLAAEQTDISICRQQQEQQTPGRANSKQNNTAEQINSHTATLLSTKLQRDTGARQIRGCAGTEENQDYEI